MIGTLFQKHRENYTTTDLVRICVIFSLTVSCILITIISFSESVRLIDYDLYFIPIIYAAYFYPKRGMIVAVVCAVIYQALGYYYAYPDSFAMMTVTLQAIFFIVISCIIAYVIEKLRDEEARYHSVFEHSQLGIVLFDRDGFGIRQVNDMFLSMLHYPSDELQKMTFSSIFLTPREQERFLERIAKEETTEDFETRFMTKEGDGCWVNLSWNKIDANTMSCSAVNINKRKLIEKLNNDNMMKYRQLTENSPTSLLIIQNGHIAYSNPTFAAVSGYKTPDVCGRDLLSLVGEPDKERFMSFAKKWEEKFPKSDNGEFQFIVKSGEIRTGAFYITPITHFGKPAILVNLIDISEKHRLQEQIRQDSERRRGVIITVAHELRTPLQPILGYLNLLIGDAEGYGIKDDAKKILERCLSSVDRERQIINQMLDLSILESGKVRLSFATFPLSDLVKKVVESTDCQQKADVVADIPDSITVTADMNRIYTVLESIISNAVNYSKPPRKIRISYDSVNGDPDHRLSVHDNGIGIAESELSSIFEPFQLADAAALSRKYDRIGLSLSVAKRIIQMHGGDITVKSTVNAGSTFTITLPKEIHHE